MDKDQDQADTQETPTVPDELTKENAEHPAFQAEFDAITTRVVALEEHLLELGAAVDNLANSVLSLSVGLLKTAVETKVNKVIAGGVASGNSSAGY